MEVITWAPAFGKIKAERIVRTLHEPQHRRLGDLTRSRRKELVQTIGRLYPEALWGAAWRDYVC